MSAVLVVEDERGVREGLRRAIEKLGHEALLASGIGPARVILAEGRVDCVLLDIRLKDGDGLSWLREIKQGPARDTPVIIATAYGDSERTIEAMRDGAFDYLTKPFDLPKLLGTVDRALKQAALGKVAPQPVPSTSTQPPLVGTSAAMLEVWKVIGRASASGDPVLITGETGTGKELVAQAIHRYSTRAGLPFVAVNLAAIAPTLIESELMGHEKGSFTGATGRHVGRLEQAGPGTLFLDEIGDLDPSLQAKLLRVIQEREFERVGGTQPIAFAARLIAATNKPVRPGQAGAALRDDLYYRLAVIEIGVPPLRERRSDIPMLVAHSLEGAPARAVSEAAMARLLAHDWPGNVRELIHVIKRAAVMCGGDVIDVADLPELSIPPTSARALDRSLESLPLREALSTVEKRLIAAALERTSGNRAEAARQLGIARPQLYAKMEEHGFATRIDRSVDPKP